MFKHLRYYCANRFYIRGRTLLGIMNTVTGCLFNRVLVKVVDSDTKQHIRWRVGRGTDFTRRKE